MLYNSKLVYEKLLKAVFILMSMTLIVQGIILGVAAVLPGLSTSVAAVLMGMYNELIGMIDGLRTDFKNSFKKLLPIGIGAVVGIVISVKIVLVVCEKFPVQSYIFFAGLVIGGFPVVLKKAGQKPFKPQYLLITAALFGVMYIISLLNQNSNEKFIAIETLSSVGNFITMMFAGAFSVSLMAIPGVSGSIMLMLIGQYGTVYNSAAEGINAVTSLLKGDMDAFKHSLMSVLLLLPFMIGALVGVLLIIKLLNFLLKNYEFAVYYGVVGILLCSVFTLVQSAVFDWPVRGSGTDNILLIGLCVVLLVIGVLCTLFLDKPSDKNETKQA